VSQNNETQVPEGKPDLLRIALYNLSDARLAEMRAPLSELITGGIAEMGAMRLQAVAQFIDILEYDTCAAEKFITGLVFQHYLRGLTPEYMSDPHEEFQDDFDWQERECRRHAGMYPERPAEGVAAQEPRAKAESKTTEDKPAPAVETKGDVITQRDLKALMKVNEVADDLAISLRRRIAAGAVVEPGALTLTADLETLAADEKTAYVSWIYHFGASIDHSAGEAQAAEEEKRKGEKRDAEE
jgi:hypothetical protein